MLPARFLCPVPGADGNPDAPLGTAAALFNAYRSWATPGLWIGTRIQDSAIAVACVAFAWLALANSLLSYGPGY